MNSFADFPDADYYDVDDGAEVLQHTDPDEAIEYHLDGLDPVLDADLFAAPLRVYAFKTETIAQQLIEQLPGVVLERLLEDLDEDYGRPEELTAATPKMELAARAFIDTIVREYKVWRCECIGYTEVNVGEWIAKNKPEWLSEEVANG